ncbi:glycosyltransferase [Secundilactobacillus muriivasis]
MKKILVFTRSLERDVGISKWIVEYYSALSKYGDVEITLMLESGKTDYSKSELNKLPFSVVKMIHIKSHPIKSILQWFALLKQSNDIDWFHFHTDNFINFIPYVVLSKIHTKVIIQSHNADKKAIHQHFIKKVLHLIGKHVVRRSNFIRFAVSDLAAKWLFKDQDYIQINNGVDLDKFKFSESTRNNLLNRYHLTERTVYGHVGRFDLQKNHNKLIEIFNDIYLKDNNAVLLLIGKGPLEQQIKQKVIDLGLEKAVIFKGMRTDVADLLNIIDVMIFPSLYEGLPLSLVEAQANGVQVFYSDTITKTVDLLNNTRAFNNNIRSEKIASQIMSTKVPSITDRRSSFQVVKKMGFDKKDVVAFLHDYYFSRI